MPRTLLHLQFNRLPTRLRLALTVTCCLLFATPVLFFGARRGEAATPMSGTVTQNNTAANPLVYTAGPFNVANPSGVASLQCSPNPPFACDNFALDVSVPDGLLDTKQIKVSVQWPNPSADFDVSAYFRNSDGSLGGFANSSGSSADPEVMILPAIPQKYVIRVVPFNPLGQSFTATLTFEDKPRNLNPGTGVAPIYKNYPAPATIGGDAGEPSIGINWITGKVFFKSGFNTLRVTFDDTQTPAGITWENKTPPTSIQPAGLDPILYTDHATGRTITSELSGGTSLSSVTDTDGDTWIPEEGGPLTSGVDHQTVGGGPYAPPLFGSAAYPNAVYYCSQDLFTAFCARSDDGGLTYGPTVPLYTTECTGIHGHVKVAPDGTVYVPNRQCGTNQGVAVSENNGITWTVRKVVDSDPATTAGDSIPGAWDPSIGVGAGGTVYFGYDNGDGRPHIAISRDKGRSWVRDQNVGLNLNLRDTAFPVVVAGDDDRASFAFLGADKVAGSQDAIWHLYVATTYDRGNSWLTVDATPYEPVQLGTICAGGISCSGGDRNLLDFIDVNVDKFGRTLVAYADGCLAGCNVASASRAKLATIARQQCGRRLFNQYDPQTDDCAGLQPTPTPTPTPTPDFCSGINVVTDATDDAINPAPGGNVAPGNLDTVDIENISFSVDAAKTTLTTTMRLKNLSLAPINGTTSIAYNIGWTGPDGKTYGTQVQAPSANGPFDFIYGEYSEGDEQFTTINFTTGTFNAGAHGTVTVDVPLTDIGSPTIPITDPAGAPAVSNPFGLVLTGEGPVLGGAVFFTTPADRAPDLGRGYGGRWSVCASGTPTPTPTPDASSCLTSFINVLNDASGDQTSAPANAQFDIQSAGVAEDYRGGTDMLLIRLKVANLSSVPPNGTWRTVFNSGPTSYYVAMQADPMSAVSYEYGTVSGTTVSITGPADGGTFAADGTITISIANNRVGSPAGGARLTAINARTQQFIGTAGAGAYLNLDTADSTPAGNASYTLLGRNTSICPATTATPTPTPVSDPTFTPRFQNFAAPNGLGTTAGEPSIGVNWQTGKVMFISNLQALRITFDDCTSPAKATWEDKSAPNSVRSLDPILFTDHIRAAGDTTPDRTFVSQLTGQDSLSSYTDNDGNLWIPSQGGGIPSGVDHQTIGAGPYNNSANPAPPPHPTYPNAVYYCSQDAVTAFCARSDDGGLTFGAGIPVYTTNCGGIHGHVKVAPDGTAYVPNKTCGGKASLTRSTDNGITWTVKSIPDSGTSGFLVDPSIGIGAGGTIYLGYQHSDSHARIAVSHDRGDNWTPSVDVGAPFGLVNTTFPEVVAGDDNRAAYAFIGTTVAGNYTDPASYSKSAAWHLYIATTFNGGASWSTIDATPTDPVQRGTICNLGTTTCQDHQTTYGYNDRNLLDFMDATVDKEGRVLVGYPDGCIGGCVNGTINSYTALASVARQTGGRRLFSSYDPTGPVAPGNPLVSATSDANGVHLSWPVPDNGGAAVVNYTVYRRTASAQRTLLANVGTATAFDDLTAQAGTTYFYTVTATNSAGESQPCASDEVTPTAVVSSGDPCTLPGLSLATDGLDAPPPQDIQQLFVAEPYNADGIDRLAFTFKVNSLAAVPPNSYWYVIWDWAGGNRQYVAAKTDATGVFSFDYGDVGPALPIPPTSVPPSNTNVPNRKGAATGTVDKIAGTIMIIVETSKVGNPTAGQTITNISPRTFGPTGGTSVVSSSAIDTISSAPSYTLVGSYFCRAQNAPLAVLNATPSTGARPLNVNFNAGQSSDPDAGDSIVSYTFNFGDGTVVTQTSAAISHVYNVVGSYHATLTVKDSRGRRNDNVADAVITVQ
ncbi:MAG: PKD domain-containing protein [Pyrinomonadaceae bacterium]